MEEKINPVITDLQTLETLINRALTQPDTKDYLIVLKSMINNTIKAGYEITKTGNKEAPDDYQMD